MASHPFLLPAFRIMGVILLLLSACDNQDKRNIINIQTDNLSTARNSTLDFRMKVPYLSYSLILEMDREDRNITAEIQFSIHQKNFRKSGSIIAVNVASGRVYYYSSTFGNLLKNQIKCRKDEDRLDQ